MPAGEARRRPPERYGDDRRRRTRWVAAVLGALGGAAGLAFVVWAGWHAAAGDVRAGLVSFDEVTDQSVTVRFEVLREPGTDVVCEVLARGANGLVVGSHDVAVPSGGPRRQVLEAVVPTTVRPATAALGACRTT